MSNVPRLSALLHDGWEQYDRCAQELVVFNRDQTVHAACALGVLGIMVGLDPFTFENKWDSARRIAVEIDEALGCPVLTTDQHFMTLYQENDYGRPEADLVELLDRWQEELCHGE